MLCSSHRFGGRQKQGFADSEMPSDLGIEHLTGVGWVAVMLCMTSQRANFIVCMFESVISIGLASESRKRWTFITSGLFTDLRQVNGVVIKYGR